MYEQALTDRQLDLSERLLPALQGFYMAGGTALALQIGHRRSLDLGMASPEAIRPFDLERFIISRGFRVDGILVATGDEFSAIIEQTKVTFFYFPFAIKPLVYWERGHIKLPGILDLGAMKSYALGRRSKWKDYVDLYFIFRFHLSLEKLMERSKELFGTFFNEKLFREQLCYFDDLDFTEQVEYLEDAPLDEEIKTYLESLAVSF
jgi:hypothetical protein